MVIFMLQTLYRQIGEYKKDSILTPIFTALEVFMEILIPFVTASIIDKGIEAGNMQMVCLYGSRYAYTRFFQFVFRNSGRALCSLCLFRIRL